jgi:hypothetical protein
VRLMDLDRDRLAPYFGLLGWTRLGADFRLNFLEVLLGDKPALTPQQSFFQRALTGDSAEATYQAELALKDEPLANYLDDVALKGLQLAEREALAGLLCPLFVALPPLLRAIATACFCGLPAWQSK